jgi:hypothetical protein
MFNKSEGKHDSICLPKNNPKLTSSTCFQIFNSRNVLLKVKIEAKKAYNKSEILSKKQVLKIQTRIKNMNLDETNVI